MDRRRAEEEEAEEEEVEETKSEANLSRVMSKNKKEENRLINQRLDAIVVKNSAIL